MTTDTDPRAEVLALKVERALLAAGVAEGAATRLAANSGLPVDAAEYEIEDLVGELRSSMPGAFGSARSSQAGQPPSGGLDRGAALWRQHNNPKGTR